MTRKKPELIDRQYSTVADAAKKMSCSQDTVRRMISRGDLTGVYLPGSRLIRVDLAEIDAKVTVIPAA